MSDLISRQAVLKLLSTIPPEEAMTKAMLIQSVKQMDSETVTECNNLISRQAVKHLDRFTKAYCRDKSVEDDLVFRCDQCEFEMPDGKCLVKVMAKKLCPDYRDFGCMGDL